MPGHYELERFVEAQDMNAIYDQAVSELSAGRKRGHWMWFIFPQIAGLGYSSKSRIYAISSLEEAQAYVRHPILGSRLTACANIVARIDGKTAVEIFGGIDALKLRSCMTLFMAAAPDIPIFRAVLDKYFDGIPDDATTARLRSNLWPATPDYAEPLRACCYRRA